MTSPYLLRPPRTLDEFDMQTTRRQSVGSAAVAAPRTLKITIHYPDRDLIGWPENRVDARKWIDAAKRHGATWTLG